MNSNLAILSDMDDALVGVKAEERKQAFRDGITNFAEEFKQQSWAKQGKEMDKMCPLKHSFANGCYIREIFMAKGTLVLSKIHKIKHPYFIMKGKCSVLTEKGIQEIEAPYHGITEPGTQRLLYIHEDTTWITVHVTEETNLKNIEEQIIAKSFEEIDALQIETTKVKEGEDVLIESTN